MHLLTNLGKWVFLIQLTADTSKLVSPEFEGDEGRHGSTLKADFMQ